jgi:hypothetical protein
MKHTPQLVSLDLSHNRLGDDGVAALCPGLCATPFIAELILDHNGIGPAGAAHLAQALAHTTALTALGVAENALGAAGAAHVAEGLRSAARLTTLSVGWNGLGPDGLPPPRPAGRSLKAALRSAVVNVQNATVPIHELSRGGAPEVAGAADVLAGLAAAPRLATLRLEGNRQPPIVRALGTAPPPPLPLPSLKGDAVGGEFMAMGVC